MLVDTPILGVRALFFDVFGTLVDWRTSVAREAKAVLEPLGYKLDWAAFADAWRGEYQPGMEEVRSGRIPFCKLDVLHRRNLERILPRFGVTALPDAGAARTHARLAPARCLAGGAGGARAAQTEIPDRAGVERQHLADGRSRPPQSISVGRDPRRRDRRRLQAEAARLSRRLRGVRSRARAMHDGGGAQRTISPPPRRSGLRTGHVARPNEHGPGTGERAPTVPVDVAGRDLSELAEKLGA